MLATEHFLVEKESATGSGPFVSLNSGMFCACKFLLASIEKAFFVTEMLVDLLKGVLPS